MTQKSNEKFIVFVTTLASIGLIIENIVMGWEFWVPIVMVGGIAAIWAVILTDKIQFGARKVFYFAYACLILFYHGIHETSVFDVALAVVLVLTTYSLFNTVYMMNIALFEYFVIVVMHMFNLSGGEGIVFDKLTVSRLIMHVVIVILCCYFNSRSIINRLASEVSEQTKVEVLTANEKDMEDFLSNISHELRTPVNVVNGMSDLLIKRNVGPDAESIKNAGIKLAYQIEDIQDYTECKREKVLLEEENYMPTSLINDVVASFRRLENNKNLELVVDLDPMTPTMMKGDIKKLHKIFRHLLENAVKFTRKGGIYVRMYPEKNDDCVNLCIEMTDTGMGMDRATGEAVRGGMYQQDKKRNRSTGGIGLGLFIVYGFVHTMDGCVKLESEKGDGTTVRITIPQKVVNDTNCLALSGEHEGDLLFHVRSDKYKVPKVRDFYRAMATHLATGIRVPLYSAETLADVERLQEKLNVKYIFMGEEEYVASSAYFDELSKGDVVVAVSASQGFKANPGSGVIVMPKPLYAYPIIKILNEGKAVTGLDSSAPQQKPDFTGVRVLVVDDEPMNLVVASGLFREYGMIVDTAESAKEGVVKYEYNHYDIVFMDHMMPEVDGVEGMKIIKDIANGQGRKATVIALTANAVSGAKEMFMREGFDGFIAKPIFSQDFERVMLRVLDRKGGEQA